MSFGSIFYMWHIPTNILRITCKLRNITNCAHREKWSTKRYNHRQTNCRMNTRLAFDSSSEQPCGEVLQKIHILISTNKRAQSIVSVNDQKWMSDWFDQTFFTSRCQKSDPHQLKDYFIFDTDNLLAPNEKLNLYWKISGSKLLISNNAIFPTLLTMWWLSR